MRSPIRVRMGLPFLALVFALGTSAAQQPASPPPFRSGIEILRIDVAVLDRDGRPVRDLTSDDFSVAINGRSRKVLFAHFAGPEGDLRSQTQPASQPGSSLSLNTTSQPGRAVMFVVDLNSVAAGSEQALLDGAAALVDSLGPNDAVGVLPAPGQPIDLTRDRERVSQALRGLRGTSPLTTNTYFFTAEEAVAFERGDKRVKDEVIERECNATQAERQMGMGGEPRCPKELEAETRERLFVVHAHAATLIRSIEASAARLRQVDVPRTIIVLSGGLAFERDSVRWFREAERAVRQVGAMLYTVQLEQPIADASTRYRPGTESYVTRDLQSGLANLATMADGAFFATAGRGTGVFDRLKSEIASSYQLGVEAIPEDAAEQPLEVRVSFTRAGLTARSRGQLVRPRGVPDVMTQLAQLISQPIDIPDLPIAATTYSVRGEEPTTLKVIIAADLGRGVETKAPVRFALEISRDGKNMFQHDGIAHQIVDTSRVLLATQLAPGSYRLRVAAVDAAGRGGSLETLMVAAVRAAGDLQSSELLVSSSADTFNPALYVQSGTALVPSVELYSADVSRFADTAVTFEARRAADDPPLAASRGDLRETALERRQIASATLATFDIPPGEYTLSAVISVNGQPVGKVSRAIIVTPALATAATSSRSGDPPAGPAALTPKTADPLLDPLLHKVGQYVAAYGDKASLIVAVEKYTQYFYSRPRQLVAEFALVKTGGPVGWIGYRDVVEVDGEKIRDRRDRLLKILTESSSGLNEASRIADESARFNVGVIVRNFNVPTTALFFFHPSRLGRFTFTSKGTKEIDGVDTIEIGFRETTRPTLIATRDGADVPSEGTLWVKADDGTVVRTSLRLRGFADDILSRIKSRAEVEVTYRFDSQLGMWLPAQMAEEYEGVIPQPRPRVGITRARATYSEFKQFGTSVRIVPQK